MPRAVSPWTWRRALRDYGPDDPGLLLSLHTLASYMDRDGYAWPSQKLWAKGSRVTERTIRRHMEKAEGLGWLAVETRGRTGRGWRLYSYRAAVPDHILLDELDEEIADAIIAQTGDVEPRERADMIVSAPSAKRADTIVSSPSPHRDVTCGHLTPNVRTSVTEGADTGDQTCGHNSVLLSSHRTPQENSSREAHAVARAPSVASQGKEAEPEKRVLQGTGIAAIGKHGGNRLRRLTDEQLWEKMEKFSADGENRVAEISRILSGHYTDVGEGRMWRLIEKHHGRQKAVV